MNKHILQSNGLNLAYDEFGKQNNPAIVLVMGLASQMVQWPVDFCEALANAGYRVIRFDNRDIGLSEKVEVKKEPSVLKTLAFKALGLPVSVPYDLHDMAQDTVGVLDALDIEAAHWVGVSMGGMIAQIVAAKFPSRCITLTSIMSTTGNPKLPQASLKIRGQLLKRPPTESEEAYIEHMLVTRKMISSPGFQMSDDELRERILLSYRRNFYPAGSRNQMVAIMATGDRRRVLKKITTPTLVIHGHDDPLVPVEGGIDTARHISNSNLHLIKGMGHDLPPGLVPILVDLILAHIDRHTRSQKAA
jgi:pimeloyl-ACP methyl ester carboxylesterase